MYASQDENDRYYVTECIETVELDYGKTLDEYIEEFQKIKTDANNRYFEIYGDAEYGGGSYDDSPSISFSGKRFLTDDEVKEYKKEEALREDKIKQDKLAQYKRLQKELGL